MSHKIKITVDKLGNPILEAIGFSGCGCTDATRPIEEAFGGEVDREAKPELFEPEVELSDEEGITI